MTDTLSSRCAPRLSAEAAEKLSSHFVSLRRQIHAHEATSQSRSSIPITIRQLEAVRPLCPFSPLPPHPSSFPPPPPSLVQMKEGKRCPELMSYTTDHPHLRIARQTDLIPPRHHRPRRRSHPPLPRLHHGRRHAPQLHQYRHAGPADRNVESGGGAAEAVAGRVEHGVRGAAEGVCGGERVFGTEFGEGVGGAAAEGGGADAQRRRDGVSVRRVSFSSRGWGGGVSQSCQKPLSSPYTDTRADSAAITVWCTHV